MKLLIFLIISLSSVVPSKQMPGSEINSKNNIISESPGIKVTLFKKKLSFKERIVEKITKNKLNKFLRKADKGDKNITAILSLSFALLAIVLLFFSVEALIYVSIASSIAAIVLGIISPKKNGKKDWKAITGLILGILELAIIILAIIVAISIINSLFS